MKFQSETEKEEFFQSFSEAFSRAKENRIFDAEAVISDHESLSYYESTVEYGDPNHPEHDYYSDENWYRQHEIIENLKNLTISKDEVLKKFDEASSFDDFLSIVAPDEDFQKLLTFTEFGYKYGKHFKKFEDFEEWVNQYLDFYNKFCFEIDSEIERLLKNKIVDHIEVSKIFNTLKNSQILEQFFNNIAILNSCSQILSPSEIVEKVKDLENPINLILRSTIPQLTNLLDESSKHQLFEVLLKFIANNDNAFGFDSKTLQVFLTHYTFNELVDALKTSENRRVLATLICSSDEFSKLQQQGIISNDNIKHFWEAFDESNQNMRSVLDNTVFLTKIFKQYGFKETINKFKKYNVLEAFLSQKAIFRPKYTDQIPLSSSDFSYLVKSITTQKELESFLNNQVILDQCFTNCAIDYTDFSRFDSLVKGIVMNKDMQTLSGYLKQMHRNTPALLDSFQLARDYSQCGFNFDDKQKQMLRNLIYNNEQARERFKAIATGCASLDFESLMQLLTKTEKKRVMNI